MEGRAIRGAVSFIHIENGKSLFPAAAAAASAVQAVESRIECIEVSGIQVILNHPHRFTEPLEVDNLPFTEEAYGVADFRILDQPQNIVIGEPCFLFCGHILIEIRNGIAGGLELAGAEGEAAGGLGPDSCRMVNIVGGEALFFQLFCRQVAGELVDDGGNDLQMGQFFGTQRSSGNVPLTVFWDGA